MKLMPCPLNGLRNINEFAYGGEVHPHPEADCDDTRWTDFVFYPQNHDEWVYEWWLHSASGYWFIAERHRKSDEIKRTFDPADFAALAQQPAGQSE